MFTSAKPWYWHSSALDSATMPFEIIRPSTLLKLTLMPCARLMFGFAPVARMEQPSEVPKNQYSSAIRMTVNTAVTKIGLLSVSCLTLRSETSRS